jgi:hypothetical protein
MSPGAMAGRRRLWWLGALIAVAIGVVLWSRSGAVPTRAASTPRAPRAAQSPAAEKEVPEPVDVRLETLKADRTAPGALERNPFRFQARAAAAPVDRPNGSEAPVIPMLPPVPAGPPPPPPITLKFIGIVERADGTKVAVLSGSGYPLYGREGDIVDGRYRVLRIGVESVELAYVDGRGRQTVKLTGQ